MIQNSKQARAIMLRRDRRALVSFSTGRDSVATMLQLREDGFDCTPFYMYRVPGLQFVERALSMYEDFFKTRIIRVAHPVLYKMLATETFTSPIARNVIDSTDIPSRSYADVEHFLREDIYNGDPVFCAIGTRAAESVNRRATFKRHGPINESAMRWSPIYDFTRKDVTSLMARHNCPLSDDYRVFGRSWDGFNYAFLVAMKQHYPDDYERCREIFPLIDSQIWRYEKYA